MRWQQTEPGVWSLEKASEPHVSWTAVSSGDRFLVTMTVEGRDVWTRQFKSLESAERYLVQWYFWSVIPDSLKAYNEERADAAALTHKERVEVAMENDWESRKEDPWRD